MIVYVLEFHENLMTLGEYQEQPYPLEKTIIVFLDSPKKMRVTFVGYSWNNLGMLLHLIFPGHYFGIFPGISLGPFSEYTENISWECSANIPRAYI